MGDGKNLEGYWNAKKHSYNFYWNAIKHSYNFYEDIQALITL